MKASKGFTLIEIVVVIVILGILSVTAAPRFLNIQSDARKSALEGFVGAFNGADGVVMGKAMVSGVESTVGKVTIPNTDIVIEDGHIELRSKNIKRAMNTDGYGLYDAFSPYGDYQVYVKRGEASGDDFSLTAKQCYLIITRGERENNILGELKIKRITKDC
ncbi:prepilin-type N-terminal cleavage/methylation domain-containing protein [Photobacterium makurazakiensis]|uniref:prepilin-type N-terminal cleavage/methylation domain-containing protein n=1 Tax=Photobacterium makurazakiensis TaxID=2910234 RepID=UPI003D0E410E